MQTSDTGQTYNGSQSRPPKDVHASVRVEFDGLFTVDVRDDDASASDLANMAKDMVRFARKQREEMYEAETGTGYQ